MWYNIVPCFIAMDTNMYSMYYSRIKGLNPLIFRRMKGYAIGATQPDTMALVEQLVQN
jgi:hypothetical protein